MAKKANRIWATRQEAVSALAEGGVTTPAEMLALLFNSTAVEMTKEANALQAGIVLRKQAAIAKLSAEVAASKAAEASKASKSA